MNFCEKISLFIRNSINYGVLFPKLAISFVHERDMIFHEP